MARAAAALLGGLALWLAFPAADLWFLAPVGVALLALATAGARVGQGALLGMLAGWAYFVPLLSWSGIYVGAFPWFALATLEALYVAALAAVCALLQRGPGGPRIRPLVVAVAWVAGELARSTTPFGGFGWGRLAFSQADAPAAWIAALAGAPGVTFAVALAGGVLAVAVRSLAAGGPRWVSAAALVGLGALVVAPLAIPVLTGGPTDGPTARILGIQGNVPHAGLDFNAQRRAVLDNHARVTRAAADSLRATGARRPDLVIWPENASDIDPLRNPDAEDVIEEAVAAVGAPISLGAVLREPAGFVSNASLLYLPGAGGPADRYVKQRPVPFAEYIPYRSFFRHFSDKVDLVRVDFAPGDRTVVFRVPRAGGGQVATATAICFEVAVDDVIRDGILAGANIITVQTNNATFGRTDESVQQLAISRLRAIEHGRSVAHISNVGVSALITPDGTAHGPTSLFTAAVLSGDLPLRTELTLATRAGPWPERAAAALLVYLLVATLIRTGLARRGARPGSASGRRTRIAQYTRRR